jgi:chromosome partitioning protein
MVPLRLCFINQKGGCGKSSTVFHLGGYFAQVGMRTLLVDADPQGSLSQGFFGPTVVESLSPLQTLAAIFQNDAFPDPAGLVAATTFDRLDVVRANQHLARFNAPSPEITGMRQFALAALLDRMDSYDIILIDCPPNLYLCSWNALLAADAVVVPVPPEDFGAQGLRVVDQAIENARVLNRTLSLLGRLVTRFDRRLIIHQTYRRKLVQLYEGGVLDSVVPEATAFKVSLATRTPVTLAIPDSAAARATAHLGQEVLSRLGLDTPAHAWSAA